MDERTFGAGRYVVVEQVGEGGMAYVFKVKDTRLGDRLCAVKVLRANLANAAKPRRRFLAEANVMAGTSHPNLVVVHDKGEENGEPYMVMEFVEGRDLEAVATAYGPLPPRAAVDITVAVARALGAVHRRGVVHRDIKPNNVMMTLDGTPKVMDFGIAHLDDEHHTKTHDMMGTRGYMAPEQIMDPSRVDGRADLFALLVMLTRLVLGKESSFYDTKGMPKILAQLPEQLRGVVDAGTKFQRDERAFKNAAQLVQALLAVRERLPVDDSGKFYLRLSGETVIDSEVPEVREVSDDSSNEIERPVDAFAAPNPRLRPVAVAAMVGAPAVANSAEPSPEIAVPVPVAQPASTRGFTGFFSGEPADDASPAAEEEVNLGPVRPNWGRRLRVPATLIGLASVLGILMYVGWTNAPTSTKTVPETPVVAPTPVKPTEVVPAPSAVAVPTASVLPVVATTAPTTSVRPTTTSKPVVPVLPAVVETPVETTRKPEGTIRVSGSGVSVDLVSAAGTFKPGAVPPGSYQVEATFEDGSTFKSDFRVTVSDGQEVSVPCSAKFKNCRAP